MTIFLPNQIIGVPFNRSNGIDYAIVVVDANKPVRIRHGLGRVPSVIFIALADANVNAVKILERDRESAVISFDSANFNAVLRIE